MYKIRFCKQCNLYTLRKNCKICGSETEINVPQKYSKDETISYYRRKLKKEGIEKHENN